MDTEEVGGCCDNYRRGIRCIECLACLTCDGPGLEQGNSTGGCTLWERQAEIILRVIPVALN